MSGTTVEIGTGEDEMTGENRSDSGAGGWQKGALVAIAALVFGGVFLSRLWAVAGAGSQDDPARRLLRAAGAEIQDRALDLEALDVPLESYPGLGKRGKQRVLGSALGGDRVVLLNFWATWCPPCIEELPSLYGLARKFGGQDLSVIAVSYDDDWDAQKEVFERLLGDVQPPHVLWARDRAGRDGDAGVMMRVRFGTMKLPETYVIKGDRIIARFVGGVDWSRPEIARALGLLVASAP